MRVEGDSVAYTVENRDAGVRYPVLLDPYVAEDQRYWFLDTTNDAIAKNDRTCGAR